MEEKEKKNGEEFLEEKVLEEVKDPEIKVEEPKEVKIEDIKYTEIIPLPEQKMAAHLENDPCVTMFRESSTMTKDEFKQPVYTGEDAVPYASKEVLLVADGLGGASGMRHLKFNRGLLASETLYDTLFKDMYGEKNEELENYVLDSFAQLISMRNLYDREPRVIAYLKKGGYFASRIVSSIFLNQVFNKDKNDNKLFNNIRGLLMSAKSLTKDLADNLLNGMCDELIEIMHKELKQIAENANLVNESVFAGMALLGSTLTATIYKENEEDVDAVYFQAGDSTGYVLDKDGFKQVTVPNERPDGSMTNYILVNEMEVLKKPFTLTPTLVNFKKPCIMLNASDGCFDSRKFVNPLAFEKVILEAVRDAKNYQEVGSILKEFFLENGHHDDSSTIAMRFLGFEKYEEWQEFAKKRLEEIEKEYLSKMPDLLEESYEAKIINVKQVNNRALILMKKELSNNPEIMEYYKEIAYQDSLTNSDLTLEEVEERLNHYKFLTMSFLSANLVEIPDDGRPIVTPGKETPNQEEVFELLTADPLVAVNLELVTHSDYANEDSHVFKALIATYNYYKNLYNELNNRDRAKEQAPVLFEEEVKENGLLPLMDLYIDRGLLTKEAKEALLTKYEYQDVDMELLEKKQDLQKELFAQYEEMHLSLVKEEE